MLLITILVWSILAPNNIDIVVEMYSLIMEKCMIPFSLSEILTIPPETSVWLPVTPWMVTTG